MKKFSYFLILLFLAIGANWAKADDFKLSLGNYDEMLDDGDGSNVYDASWWMVSPTQFYAKHSGSQIIYTKDQLAPMAGKEIKSISFVYYNLGCFNALPRTVNVWVKEIDGNEFAYSAEKKAYEYFEYSDAQKVATDFSFEDDFLDYYCLNGEMTVNFDKPFAYSGDKNLLITITFDGDDTAGASSDIEFYYNTDATAKNKAMTTCSDKSTFAEYNESEDWPYAKGGGYAISHAEKLEQPLTKFTCQEGSKPAVKPASLSGTVKSGETAIEGAKITLKSGDISYEATSEANGAYTISVPAENIDKQYTVTATAEGYEDYTATETMTFTSDDKKSLDIEMVKKDVPSTMTGKVTCNGEPVEGATLKLAAADNKYLTYTTTTSADGTYLLRVVKSEKTYNLSVTDGECEDYTENGVIFTPGETMMKDIQLTKTPDPENTLTLGKYNKLLKDGTGLDGEVYYGHGYSWAAVPTNFSHRYTGSQIIYTKEQLAELNGKAITKINFICHNESAYESYPRTVKVWVKESDDNAFAYDTKSAKYKFFEYADASVAIADYQYAGELIDFAGENAELELTFDSPLNYNGKNLIVTLTFEGDNTCNPLDFNFYCNNDEKKRAMAYFSDNYTFGEYAETEDWPFESSDCVDSMEQPVTRFFYTGATDGINIVSAGSAAASNGATYNLAGQRVGKDYKGIVVSNGKKYVK